MWWSLGWSLATACFLAAMGGAGYYVFNRAVSGGPHVRVPNIGGRPIAEAYQVLAQQGLEVGKQILLPSDQVPKGYVIAQRPAAGTVVRAGRRISPTVSSGHDFPRAPDLANKTLDQAQELIALARLKVGAGASIPHSSPRNTVIAQYPPRDAPIPPGSEIHLLVSDGLPSQPFFMPELVGKPLDEAVQVLASLPATAVPYLVDRPEAPLDVVLAQQPSQGTLLRAGDTVTYDVATERDLPTLGRRVEVRFAVPGPTFKRDVRVDVVLADGARKTVYPREQDYIGGMPPELDPGTTITIPQISFVGQVTVEFFVDGEKARSYYFRGRAEPVTTDFGDFMGENGRAPTQDSPFYSGQ